MPDTTLPIIHAIYATTSGNTELVVDTVIEVWRAHGYVVETHRSERTPPSVITDNALFLFGTSTWDHGTINPFFIPLYEALAEINCAGKSAFFIGLGDIRYEPVLFNMAIQHVLDRWTKQGGKELYHPLKINGDPHPFMAELVLPWAEATWQELDKVQQGAAVGAAAPTPVNLPSSLARAATSSSQEEAI